ncbi:MAG TPA: hypothetical protein VER79_00910 [Candidatus Limnocylindrales bacterium]|nr:hypothetical protein [Candidatus Limnocylindrales bacterium]
MLEFEGDDLAQRAQQSLSAIIGRPAETQPVDYQQDLLDRETPAPKRRGRPPKAAAAEAKPAERDRKRRPRSEAATAQIRRLRDEGYFVTARRASEVKSTLGSMGYELENRQIYATLKYMADKGILDRSEGGEDGVWLYSGSAPEA